MIIGQLCNSYAFGYVGGFIVLQVVAHKYKGAIPPIRFWNVLDCDMFADQKFLQFARENIYVREYVVYQTNCA